METLSITNHYDGAYAYDAFGRMGEASFEGMDFHYAYLPGSDLVKGLTYGAVKKTVAFEAQRNLVTGISYHTVADALIAERTYSYNALGNVVARTRQRGADPVETDDFDHNLRSELIAASLGGTNAVSGDYGYAYDPIGNRVVSTNRSDVTAYASNELNQYTNIISDAPFTPEFDDDGNQILVKTSTGIWHVTYNAENRPVVWSNATSVIAMDYDFMGRRVSKRLLSGEGETVDRQFLYDGYLQISAIETNAVTTTFWDPTEPIATRPLAMKDGSFIDTYTHDLTKNVMEVLDPGGDPVVVYDYDAFGAMTASRSYLNRFGFSSEYYDSDLGCIYYNYRHYNPLDGRWVSRDPIGERGGHNRYRHLANNATVTWDYLGLTSDVLSECKNAVDDFFSKNSWTSEFTRNDDLHYLSITNWTPGMVRQEAMGHRSCQVKITCQCDHCREGEGDTHKKSKEVTIRTNTGDEYRNLTYRATLAEVRICSKTPGSHRVWQQVLAHELQHVRDECQNLERKEGKESCWDLYPWLRNSSLEGKFNECSCANSLCGEMRAWKIQLPRASNPEIFQTIKNNGYFEDVFHCKNPNVSDTGIYQQIMDRCNLTEGLIPPETINWGVVPR